jgi:hypothetical protein
MHRRTFAGVLGSIAAGTVGYAAFTNTAEATTVNVDGYEIDDKEVQTPTPVNGATLDVSGSYQWQTSVTPTDVTLRLTVTYATEEQQLAAMRVPGELTPEDSGEFDMTCSLLDHSEINAPALTPTEVGETKELTFDTALTMIVDGDSGELGRQTVTETATITVEKEQAGVKTSLSVQGTIDVTTKTPV